MARWLIRSLVLLPVGALFFVACVGDSPATNSVKAGTEGGACFDNATCNAGLVCVLPNTCVRPDGGDAASPIDAADAGGDAASPTDAADGSADAGADAPACGAPGQACCALGACAAGGCCVASSPYPPGLCVGPNQACYNGAFCANGGCGSCGLAGQACCPASSDAGIPSAFCSSAGTGCNNGVCTPCGGSGQPCCPNQQCGVTLTCQANTCL